MTALQDVSTLWAAMIWSAGLVFLRVGAMLALLPAFGEQSVPLRLRLALAVAFTAVVAPAVWPDLPENPGPGHFAAEAAAGLVLGIGLRLFILALQTAAAIIAQSTSLSQLLAGTGPEPQPAIGHLLTMAALALAVGAGLHIRAAELLILSYDLLPAGSRPLSADMADWGLGRTSQAFGLAFSLAAPFAAAALLYNLALGAINRAMPALMVSFVGAPALAWGGLVLLALMSPVLLGLWLDRLNGFLAAPFSPGATP